MTYIKRRRTKYYGAAGTVDPNYDIHVITASSDTALTLINPSYSDTGKVLEIISKTAYFHSVTISGGLGGDSSKATYTFRGRIGDSLTIVAIDGLWYPVTDMNGYYGDVQDYTASGAIAIAYDFHTISVDGVGAMTLAAPTAAQTGRILSIVSTTANAHTLTYTGGFGGGGAGEDVATFSGAVGDSITLRAIGTLWYVVGTHQVTLA